MRKCGYSTALGLSAAVSVLAAGDARAQGFFEQLFGGGGAQMTAPQSRPGQMIMPGRPIPLQNFQPRNRSEDDDEREARSGKYKTVCVRMCDGYFFPISNSTSKKGFFRDQVKCRSSCGDDARLFHMPVGATEMSTATDGQGRIYGLLAVANRYKKALTPGCQCRPAPWSDVEMARHAQYAEAEAEKILAERAAQVKLAAADKTIGEKAAAVADTEGKEKVAPASEAKAATVALRAGGKSSAASKPSTAPRQTATQQTQAQQAQLTQTQQQARSAQTAAKAAPLQGGMGLGAGGYAWPGDAPKR